MSHSSSRWNNLLLVPVVLILVGLFSGCQRKAAQAPEVVATDTTQSKPASFKSATTPIVDTVKTISDVKLKLTEEYCLENYGVKSARLDSQKMIVVHYTAVPTLAATIVLFKRDFVSPDRKYIKQFSRLNVGIHYVIDKDGKIYNLLPDTVVARHIIGFNHVALGIENVASDSSDLTDLQLKSNISLIAYLSQRYPSIQYLIGHGEYNQKDLPHFSLFKSLNEKYAPYNKSDPGQQFMKQIRDSLAIRYGLVHSK